MAKKKKKRKVPVRVQLRRLKAKADKALSEYVREVAKREYDNKCPFCHRDPTVPVWNEKKKKWMQNKWVSFHFVSRRRKSVRWDIADVIGACSWDNARERSYPDPYRAFYIRKFGVDKYLYLVDKSLESFEPTIEFLQGIVDEYTERLRTLKGGEVFPETVRPQAQPDVPPNPDNMKGAGDEFGGEDFPSSQ